ncbi:MAG: DUF480 domain-containing protein [Planctomycetota bacterium]|nr:DUF480 domain-containing protein [Planctomycetota bacterium]
MSDPIIFDERQQRVLGVLIEKSLTNPHSYPLTLNQVVIGCNQKSSRDPVVSWMEDEVDEVLTGLGRAGFASQVHGAGSRVGKWRQELTGSLALTGQAMAVLAELLLRGPQTLGELRTRASRMKDVPDLSTLAGVLTDLAEHSPPLASRFSPDGVKRGVRWGHLLQSESAVHRHRVAEETGITTTVTRTPTETSTRSLETRSPELQSQETGRLDRLEKRVQELHDRVERLEKNSR